MGPSDSYSEPYSESDGSVSEGRVCARIHEATAAPQHLMCARCTAEEPSAASESTDDGARMCVEVQKKAICVPKTVAHCRRQVVANSQAMCAPVDPDDIMVIPRGVESIARDAPLSRPSLKAIVVDRDSPARPEDCDFGREATDYTHYDTWAVKRRMKQYRHIPVFRINTAHPPLVSLPDMLFKRGDDIPVLMYSEEEQTTEICGKTLECSGGYCIRYVRYDRPCVLDVEGVGEVKVRDWCEAKDYGVEGGMLRIPYGVNWVGDWQYKSNQRVTAVHIPATVGVVGESAFYRCTSLTDVKLLSGVRELKPHAFRETKITSLRIPASVTAIGACAFHSAPLKSVAFEEGSALESVGNRAFGSTELTTITFPPSVTSFGEYVFNNTSIAHIDVPGNAKFSSLFLCGIKMYCTVCFYNCRTAPHIKYTNRITVKVIEGSPFMASPLPRQRPTARYIAPSSARRLRVMAPSRRPLCRPCAPLPAYTVSQNVGEPRERRQPSGSGE